MVRIFWHLHKCWQSCSVIPKDDTGDELPPILKNHSAIQRAGERFKLRVYAFHPWLDWFKLVDVRLFGRSELTIYIGFSFSIFRFLSLFLRFRSCGGWLLRWGVSHGPLLIPFQLQLFHFLMFIASHNLVTCAEILLF